MSCCNVHLISMTEINNIAAVSLDADHDIMNSIITSSQDMALMPVLGNDLYMNLVSAVESQSLDSCQDELLCQLKPFLAWFIAKEWTVRSMAIDTPSGLRVLNEPNSAPAAERLVNNVMQGHITKIVFYESRLRSYLNEASDCFPLWKKHCNSNRNMPFSFGIAAVSQEKDWKMWPKDASNDYYKL
jgi:hypothetical protein